MGGASINIESQEQLTMQSSIQAYQADWTQYTLTDTLTLQITNSLFFTLFYSRWTDFRRYLF